MITKERRSRLREQWETEEEQYMVEVWDWTRRTEEDRVTRAYWDERRREA